MLTPARELSLDLPNIDGQGTHRLAYYEWENLNAAETVICVHGLTRNGRDFDLLASALSEKYRVLCPDMPGRGKSQWLSDPAGYSYPAYVADMLAFTQKLSLSNMRWVGTSMGGIIAMMVQNAAPGLLHSLVLNDIGCLVPASGLARILESANRPALFSSREEAEAEFRKRLATFGIREEAHWQMLFATSIEALADGKFRFACDPKILEQLASQEIKDVDLWPLWEAAKSIPVLLLRGENSDILLKDTALAMQASHSRLTYEQIPGAGHTPALMDVNQIALIKSWLSQN